MSEREDKLGCRLWREYAARRTSVPGGPEIAPNLLAAYLDGKADPEAVERIEARMAEDPDLLEAVLEFRRLQDFPTPPAPPAVATRAKSLVVPAVQVPHAVIAAAGRWWQKLQWAAAAAVIIVAGLGGYSFGGDTFLARQTAEQRAAAQVTGEIEDLISEPDLSVTGQANGSPEGQS